TTKRWKRRQRSSTSPRSSCVFRPGPSEPAGRTPSQDRPPRSSSGGRRSPTWVGSAHRTGTLASRSALLKLIDFVVERLEADPQFLGRGRLVAVVLFEHDLDVLHLDVAQRGRAIRDLEVRTGDCGGRRRGSHRPPTGDLRGKMLGANGAAPGEDRG